MLQSLNGRLPQQLRIKKNFYEVLEGMFLRIFENACCFHVP